MILFGRPVNADRRQRRAAGRGLRRTAVFLSVFALTLTGLAAPAQAAPIDLAVLVNGSQEVRSGQTLDMGALVSGIPGDFDVTSVRAVIDLPEGVTPVEWEGDADKVVGPCAGTGATVTCTVTKPENQDPQNYALLWGFALRFDAPAGTKLPIKVTVSSDGEEQAPASNTVTHVVTVIEPTDLGITVEKVSGPSGPGNVVKYTYVVHNYGSRATTGVGFAERQEPKAFGSGGFTPASLSCVAETSPDLQCIDGNPLAAGRGYRATRTVSVPADSELWGKKIKITASVSDLPPGGAENDNNVVSFELDFTGKPATGTPTTAPTDGTAAPQDGGSGGGLPITGSATMPLMIGGVLLLVAGMGAVLLTRRRRA